MEKLAGTAFAESKRLEITDNGDCAAGHGGDRVLPNGHDKTKGLSAKTCKNCHSRNKQNLQGKIPLSHLHLWKGTFCRNCHGEATPPKALTTGLFGISSRLPAFLKAAEESHKPVDAC